MSGAGNIRWRTMTVALMAAGGVLCDLAQAEPLPKEECDKLKTEQASLEKGGVKDVLLKGPAWARANPGSAMLKDIERYITLEEQLNFRCGLARARLTLPFAEEDRVPAEPDEAAKADDAPPPAAKPKPKPKAKAEPAPPAEKSAAAPAPAPTPPKPKPKPKPAETKAAAPEPAAASEAPPKPAAKPKPKVDDAFKPPATQGRDPFAGQVPAPPKSP